MLKAKGYELVRIRGSHHIFARPDCPLFSIPVHNGKVKYAYVRKIKKL